VRNLFHFQIFVMGVGGGGGGAVCVEPKQALMI
jgi:hypothetical protein